MPRNNYYGNPGENDVSIPFGYTISPTEPADKLASRPAAVAETEPDEKIYAGSKATEAISEEAGQPATEVVDMIENATRVGAVSVRPVVGWVVGVKGVSRGVDFRLHSGRNYIGRDSNLEVFLDDAKVSRDPAVQIVFDPKSRAFLIGPCDRTSTLSYHNDKVLMGMHELAAYDRIQLGDCELMFVPLCGEHLIWQEDE